jgi:hypothetical protein
MTEFLGDGELSHLNEEDRQRLSRAIRMWAWQHPRPELPALLFSDLGVLTPRQVADGMAEGGPVADRVLYIADHVAESGGFDDFIRALERRPAPRWLRLLLRTRMYVRVRAPR